MTNSGPKGFAVEERLTNFFSPGLLDVDLDEPLCHGDLRLHRHQLEHWKQCVFNNMWVWTFPNMLTLLNAEKPEWWTERWLTDRRHPSLDPQLNEQLVQLGLLSWGSTGILHEWGVHWSVAYRQHCASMMTDESFSNIGTLLPEMILSSWGLLSPRCFCCSKSQIWFCREMIWKTGQTPWEMNWSTAAYSSSPWIEPGSYWARNSAWFLRFAASFGSTRHAVLPALPPVLQVNAKRRNLCANNSNCWTQTHSKN